MPRSARPLLEALQIMVPLRMQQDDVDIEKLRFAQYLRKEEDMDEQLKEVAERRRMKAAGVEAKSLSKSETLATKTIKHPRQVDAAKSLAPTLGTLSQKQKPKEELTAQRQLQLTHQQELSEMTDKAQKRPKVKGGGKGKGGRMQMTDEKSKKQTLRSNSKETWNSSWQSAEVHWEIHSCQHTSTYVDNQSEEMWYATGQSQPQQHTQQHVNQERYARTPSPPLRTMPPAMANEGYSRMATLLQEAQCNQRYKQHQQEQQSQQSWETCAHGKSMWSWDGGGRTESTEVWEAGVNSQRVLDRMLGKQLHLTQFEPIEYGAGPLSIDDAYD